MNLSRVKIVATIANFNPKKGYPEFGTHTVKSVKPVLLSPVEATEPVVKVIPKWKRRKTAAIKDAKKAFNKRVGVGYKPTLLVSSKLS